MERGRGEDEKENAYRLVPKHLLVVSCNLKKGNVQGDELIARGWQKYLQTDAEVESVYLYGSDSVIKAPDKEKQNGEALTL